MDWNNALTLEGHNDDVIELAFSPDNETIASCGKDKTIRLWSSATGEEKQKLCENILVNHIVYSPDGKTLASCSDDSTIRFWNTVTGEEKCEERKTLKRLSDEVVRLAYSKDSKILTSLSRDGAVRLWDTEKGHMRKKVKFPCPHKFRCRNVLSPDGATLVSFPSSYVPFYGDLSSDSDESCSGESAFDEDKQEKRKIRIWSTLTGKEMKVFECADEDITHISAVAVVPDSNAFASVSSPGKICVWNSTTGNNRRTLEDSLTYSIAFAPDGKTLALTSAGSKIRLLDGETLRESKIIHCGGDTYRPIVFSADGKMLAVGNRQRTILVFSTIPDEKDDKYHEDYNPPSVTRTFVELWNPATMETIRTARDSQACALAFSSNGTEVLSISWDHAIIFWDAITGEEKRVIRESQTFTFGCVTWSPADDTIATSSYPGVDLWDRVSWTLKKSALGDEFKDSHLISDIAFSHDGETIAICFDTYATVRDVATGDKKFQIETDSLGDIRFLSFGLGKNALIPISFDGVRILGYRIL
ncbi:WD-repeat protein [Penicillium lagena]|uniref:WD-repeat protein n=1 Tax=Penicillium lagena TaxID=94218 RepID=UPI002542576A|nr:WD-repeat protein [Penicillium lagena]KAJ5604561.1 WD-repeat protein [Penicillium lagena]